jgi:hypothetical protein
MYRIRALTASLALAVGLAGATFAMAPVASATGTTGAFATWRQAQAAAGFALRQPTRLLGLKRTSPVNVSECDMPGQHGKLYVTAAWGSTSSAFLFAGESNSAQPCFGFTEGVAQGTVQVAGVTAHVFGDCGTASGLQPCSSPGVFLQLIWKKNGVIYTTISRSETRAALVSFSRSLRRTG